MEEEGTISLGTKVTGLLVAFGYALGVIVQWIVYCSDKAGIKFGITFSLIFLFLLLIYRFSLKENLIIFSANNNYFIVEGILNFLFSFGFGFSVPSLFSLIATKISSAHHGKLFGAIDTTDTLANIVSTFSLELKEKHRIKEIFFYSIIFCVYIISFYCYKFFIKKISFLSKATIDKDGSIHEHK